MARSDSNATSSTLWLLLVPPLLVVAAILTVQMDQAGTAEPVAGATYTRGVLDLTIPSHAAHGGSGRLSLEVLDPEDKILGSAEQDLDVAEGNGHWRQRIALAKPLPIDELVWHRVRPSETICPKPRIW